MKVTVDNEGCCGHGVCASLCPDIFTINDDGYAEITVTEVPAQHQEAALEAAQSCPEQAISVTEQAVDAARR